MVVHKNKIEIEVLLLPATARHPAAFTIMPSALSPPSPLDTLRYEVVDYLTNIDYLLHRLPEPVWLQFDGSANLFTLRMGVNSGLLLRAHRSGASVQQLERMVDEMVKQKDPWDQATIVKARIWTGMMFPSAKAWCEICGQIDGLLECKGCEGAYYCGEGHQKRNWSAQSSR